MSVVLPLEDLMSNEFFTGWMKLNVDGLCRYTCYSGNVKVFEATSQICLSWKDMMENGCNTENAKQFTGGVRKVARRIDLNEVNDLYWAYRAVQELWYDYTGMY